MARFSTEVYATSNLKPASFRSLAEREGWGVKGNAAVSMTAGVSVKVLVLFDWGAVTSSLCFLDTILRLMIVI